MWKAKGRKPESNGEEWLTGGPAPARSFAAGRSIAAPGNGSRATSQGVRDAPGRTVGTVDYQVRGGEETEKKSVYF